MTLLLIATPLIGALIAGFGGRFVGNLGAAIVTTTLLFSNVIFALILFWSVSFKNCNYFLNLGTWIVSGNFIVEWSFLFDNLTMAMLLVVNFISALVHLYSTEYMKEDPHLSRFMSYLSLFTFFMLILVTADNFVLLFLGWEGVGLCSYLLISFWYTRIQAGKSALKALIVNRVSDFAFTIGILTIYFVFNSVSFSVVFPLVPFVLETYLPLFDNSFSVNLVSLMALLLFVGAVGKSAQLGLHTWLPDAMEGPTPVSALIHAATMVTAGVFLVIRCSPLFEYAPSILLVVTFLGAFTAFFAATTGLVQSDIKKIIAYSTCSQLGYMFFICGLSGYQIGLFHLVNHAFFKALLFLSAGAIIHSVSSEQDMRRFGGFIQLLPFTYIMLFIGSLSLMGFPFLTGYYSKDLILEYAFAQYTLTGTTVYFLGLLTAFLTSFYSLRIIFLTFISHTNAYKTVINLVHELPSRMALALMVLGLGSIFWGYLTRDFFVGLGTNFWLTSIFVLPHNNLLVEAEFIPVLLKWLPLFFSLLALVLVLLVYHISFFVFFFGKKLWFTVFYQKPYAFLSNKWYFDAFYNNYINRPLLLKAYTSFYKELDKGLIEASGPVFFSQSAPGLGGKLTAFLQSGLVYHYAIRQTLFLIVFILVVSAWAPQLLQWEKSLILS